MRPGPDPLALARTLAAATVWTLTWVAPAGAQVPSALTPPEPSRARDAGPQANTGGPRWEIEGHGGVLAAAIGGTGSAMVPSPGAPVPTSSPIFPSRQIPSWLFGDGATLLNDVNAAFNVPSRIAPLDAAFSSRGLDPARATIGVRLRRVWTSRLSAELSVDATASATPLPADLAAKIASTRASFTTAMTALLSTGPFANAAVDASSTTANGTSREIVATGAINLRFGTRAGFAPYATFGAGVTAGTGTPPSATLDGHYHFSILGTVPIDETDHVSIRYVRSATVVGVLGGGLRRDLSDQWGIVIDARAFLGRNNIQVLLDAHPGVTRGAPAGFIESFTSPAVQFSNDPATGRQSTLSGAPIQGFTAFAGGFHARVLVTFGVCRRF
jgi:hypothetical protein